MSKRPKWIIEPEIDPNGSKDDHRHVAWGRYLSKAQTAHLEKGLLSTPDDLRARLQLIGYYQEQDRDPRIWCHVFWMIEYRPRDWFCYYLPVPRTSSVKKAELIKNLWRAQIRKQPRDWCVLCSAASHLSTIDERLSLSLLKRALKLKPQRGLPARRLAQHYRFKAIRGPQAMRSSNARLAFKYANLALELEDALGEKVGILTEFTWVAIRERRPELARKWATKLVHVGRTYPMPHWEQYGYIYFAAINLAADKNSLCIRNLNKFMLSIESDPSHVIDNPALLSTLVELVRRGERDAVLRFVRAAKSLSVRHKGKTDWRKCIQELQAGKSPIFHHSKNDPRVTMFKGAI
jgi:hypothetical protein